MLTLLLKTSLIWGLLLLLYFGLLSKEKSYAQARIYLWLTLLSGICLPVAASYFEFWEPAAATGVPANINFNPTDLASPAMPGGPAANNETATWGWHKIVWIIWLAGAGIQLCLLLKSMICLYRLKVQSRLVHHSVADYYTHASVTQPFSFGRTIFIPQKAYPDAELHMILQHERYHHLFRHAIDNIVLATGKIIFWFHPLYHILQHQLKLLHEYQVDECLKQQYGYTYGKLLVTQVIAQPQPALTNTFYYSPLKKRIAMLTSNRKSQPWKYLFSLPVLTLSFIFMSANKPNDERVRDGNTTTFRGNTFTWADPPPDEKKDYAMPTFERIVRYNGQEVKEGLSRISNTMQYEFQNKNLETLTHDIVSAIEANIALFPQKIATISLENLTLNEQGDILYYDVKTLGVSITDTTISGTNRFPDVNTTVDKILKDRKLINPASLQLDNVYTVSAAVAWLREYQPMKGRLISTPSSKD